MVTIAQVLTWKSTTLDQAADGLYALRKQLVDLQDEVDDSRVPGSWWGEAANAATKEHGVLVDDLRDITAEVAKVAASLDLAGAEVKSACDALEKALGDATAKGLQVDHTTGEVTDPKTYDDAFEQIDASATVASIATAISAALTQATQADADLALALTAAADGTIDGGDGTLADAGSQLPAALDGMSPKEIAAKYGDNVAIDTYKAWLGIEAEFATWELEGKAEAEYKIMGDGKVVMGLTLEAGLGREIDVGGAEVDASAGGTTNLELTFDNQAEADAFLDGLADKATDLGLTDLGNVPGAVAGNVAEYVMKQDITSFKTGVYGKASAEFDSAVASGEAEGRVDGYYDWVNKELGIKISASADAEIGPEGSGVNGSASLSGEIKFHEDQMSEATFSGRISADVANDKLGLDLPAGTSTGQAVDVQLTMNEDNPRFDEFKDAIKAGDVDGATDIAYNDGEATVRSTTIEKYADEKHELDLGVAEGEIDYGAEGELANQVWVRRGGQGYWVDIDPEAVRG
jgi:hypothetical protein